MKVEPTSSTSNKQAILAEIRQRGGGHQVRSETIDSELEERKAERSKTQKPTNELAAALARRRQAISGVADPQDEDRDSSKPSSPVRIEAGKRPPSVPEVNPFKSRPVNPDLGGSSDDDN